MNIGKCRLNSRKRQPSALWPCQGPSIWIWSRYWTKWNREVTLIKSIVEGEFTLSRGEYVWEYVEVGYYDQTQVKAVAQQCLGWTLERQADQKWKFAIAWEPFFSLGMMSRKLSAYFVRPALLLAKLSMENNNFLILMSRPTTWTSIARKWKMPDWFDGTLLLSATATLSIRVATWSVKLSKRAQLFT